MPNIGAPELIVILVIALLIIGPGKLPDVGSALGKSIREFRKASSDVQEAAKIDKIDVSPLPPDAPPAAPEPNVLHTPSTPPASESAESNR
jgi:TatA/E family protein of Tat protein translocase